MENWGLIMYSEPALLYNPAASSIEDKKWVVSVISHELAHMVSHLMSSPSELIALIRILLSLEMCCQ